MKVRILPATEYNCKFIIFFVQQDVSVETDSNPASPFSTLIWVAAEQVPTTVCVALCGARVKGPRVLCNLIFSCFFA